VDADVSAGDLGEGGFEMILDTIAARLALPAGEWAAIIRDEQLEPLDG
jgi:hypothetical protein